LFVKSLNLIVRILVLLDPELAQRFKVVVDQPVLQRAGLAVEDDGLVTGRLGS